MALGFNKHYGGRLHTSYGKSQTGHSNFLKKEMAKLKKEVDQLLAENKELKEYNALFTDVNMKALANEKVALQCELDKAKELLKYPYSLPMNEAGSYEENIAWKEAVEQVLKGKV